MAFRKRKIAAKTPAELDAMEAAGRIVGIALQEVRAAAAPGIATKQLDEVAEAVIRDHGAVPTFLGYNGFTGSICASVNEVVVHGIQWTRCLPHFHLVQAFHHLAPAMFF